MPTEITKKQKCLIQRNGIEIWLDEDKANALQQILDNITEHKFIRFNGRSINTADCTGVYLPEDILAEIIETTEKKIIQDIENLILRYKENELRGDYSDVDFAENEINRKLIDWIIEDIEKLIPYEKRKSN